MGLLLDTHIWVWSMLEPDRLSRKVVTALQREGADLWLSPISIWELTMLVQGGRVQLEVDVIAWTKDALRRAPLNQAPLTDEIAFASAAVELPHPDPADRFLVATAQELELTLVTADQRLIESRAVKTLANT
jgi:PIN domain nuclease of toxin-antitoxin system